MGWHAHVHAAKLAAEALAAGNRDEYEFWNAVEASLKPRPGSIASTARCSRTPPVAIEWSGMGLDIYVGSLTRYYAGDWELIAQQAAREMGVPLRVMREHADPADAIRDPSVIRPVVKQMARSII